MNNKFTIPIVLIIYKRPEVTSIALEAIRKVQPTKMYVIADGPKNKSENSDCLSSRKIIEEGVDWNCKLVKIYSKENMGLRNRVVSGLNKVFKKEEVAIILEDDCVANKSFFKFCEIMLGKYKDNNMIFSISSNNFQFGNNKIEESYYFSKHFHSWGWATWKRAWSHYDDNLNDWPKQKITNFFKDVFPDGLTRKYWEDIFNQVYKGTIDSWSYRWSYTHFVNNSLSIIPKQNLVSNIGHGKDATHTFLKDRRLNMPTHSLNFPLKHPNKITPNLKADNYTDKTVYASHKNRIIILVKSILSF